MPRPSSSGARRTRICRRRLGRQFASRLGDAPPGRARPRRPLAVARPPRGGPGHYRVLKPVTLIRSHPRLQSRAMRGIVVEGQRSAAERDPRCGAPVRPLLPRLPGLPGRARDHRLGGIDALANAHHVIAPRAARSGAFFEPGFQQALIEHTPWLIDVANWMYLNSHFVVTTGFLAWLYLFRNDHFYFVRNMFLVAMGLALVGYALFPTAPPRMFPERRVHRHDRGLHRRRPGLDQTASLLRQQVRRGAEHAHRLLADGRGDRREPRPPPRRRGSSGRSTRWWSSS